MYHLVHNPAPLVRVHTGHTIVEVKPCERYCRENARTPSQPQHNIIIIAIHLLYNYIIIMMKVAVLAALAGSAVAFAPPSQQARTSTAVSATEAQKAFFGLTSKVDFSKELGVQPPVSAQVSFCAP